MKRLEKNWFVEGIMDFEYKTYVILDYIQYVNSKYKENKLFPTYPNLLTTYKSTLEFKQILDSFKKTITTKTLVGINWQEEKLVYEETKEDGFELTSEIELIIDYALPIFKKAISEGKRIYSTIDESISLDCVGIEPIYKKEGYLIIRSNKTFFTFKYNTCILKDSGEFSLPIEIIPINSQKSTLSNNIEKIKNDLTVKQGNNFIVFFSDVESDVPLHETAIQIIKRKLNFLINS